MILVDDVAAIKFISGLSPKTDSARFEVSSHAERVAARAAHRPVGVTKLPVWSSSGRNESRQSVRSRGESGLLFRGGCSARCARGSGLTQSGIGL